MKGQIKMTQVRQTGSPVGTDCTRALMKLPSLSVQIPGRNTVSCNGLSPLSESEGCGHQTASQASYGEANTFASTSTGRTPLLL